MSNSFYFPPSRLAFIEGLQNDCNQSGVIAIEGPMGIGKTTVLEELLTSTLSTANKCYITAAESLNDIQIRSRIVEQLFGNVLYDPEKPLLTTFLEFHKSIPIMMAIDNGHHLSGQIVGELLQVVAELKKQGSHIVLLLCFDKTISNTIGSITSALIMLKHVPGFTSEESYSLLTHSFDNVPSPTTSKVKRWLSDAKGNPSQLLAFDTTDKFNVAPSAQINIKLWGSILAAFSLLLALGVYGYRVFFLSVETDQGTLRNTVANEVNNKGKPAVVSDWSKAKIETLAEQKKIKEVTANSNTGQALENATANKAPETVSTNDDDDTRSEDLSAKEANTANNQDILDALNLTHSLVSTLPSTDSIDRSELAEPTTEAESPEPMLMASPEVGDKSKQEAESTSSESLKNELSFNEKTNLDENAQPKPEMLVTETLIAGYPIKTQDMLALPANKFVLQLTAVTQEKTLETYLLNKKLPIEQTRIYRITRNNQTWLILTYGLFDTIAEARQVAVNVDSKAWAKSVSVIQQQIKKFNQTLSQ